MKDFEIFTSEDKKVEASNADMLRLARVKYGFKATALNFMRKIMMHNGMGPKCAIPPNMIEGKHSIDDARSEVALVMFQTVQKLLEKTKVKPS